MVALNSFEMSTMFSFLGNFIPNENELMAFGSYYKISLFSIECSFSNVVSMFEFLVVSASPVARS